MSIYDQLNIGDPILIRTNRLRPQHGDGWVEVNYIGFIDDIGSNGDEQYVSLAPGYTLEDAISEDPQVKSWPEQGYTFNGGTLDDYDVEHVGNAEFGGRLERWVWDQARNAEAEAELLRWKAEKLDGFVSRLDRIPFQGAGQERELNV